MIFFIGKVSYFTPSKVASGYLVTQREFSEHNNKVLLKKNEIIKQRIKAWYGVITLKFFILNPYSHIPAYDW